MHSASRMRETNRESPAPRAVGASARLPPTKLLREHELISAAWYRRKEYPLRFLGDSSALGLPKATAIGMTPI
jgi:hypothetical protein